jgi:membrane carboxypeptidase/penicillin-binding protein
VVDRDPAWGLSNRAVLPGRWVAGKTGTTNDERDIWFVGATPGIVASVWIGNDDNSSLPKTMILPDGKKDTVTSSRQPIYIWKDFVENALRGHSANPDGFPVPDGIDFQRIDLKTGALDPQGTLAAFKAGTDLGAQGFMPTIKLQIPIDKRTGKRATADTPPDQIDIIDVDPKDVDQYLPATAGLLGSVPAAPAAAAPPTGNGAVVTQPAPTSPPGGPTP